MRLGAGAGSAAGVARPRTCRREEEAVVRRRVVGVEEVVVVERRLEIARTEEEVLREASMVGSGGAYRDRPR